MKIFSAHIEDLRSLYITNLKKALDMEEKITKALPEMIENSTDPELTDAFRMHLEETQGHVATIESLASQLSWRSRNRNLQGDQRPHHRSGRYDQGRNRQFDSGYRPDWRCPTG